MRKIGRYNKTFFITLMFCIKCFIVKIFLLVEDNKHKHLLQYLFIRLYHI